MDFATINRAQRILNSAALIEKTAGKEAIPASVLGVLSDIASHGVRAGKEIGKAGWRSVGAGAKSLEEAGHPILGFGVRTAPIVGGAYGAKKGHDKYQQWKLERAYRKQMGM